MIDSPLLNDRLARPTASPDPIHVRNPVDGAVLASLPRAGADETREAIATALGGLELRRSTAERGRWLADTAAVLRENRDELARIITLENGKPIEEAKGEVDYAAGFFDHFAAQVRRLRSRRLAERPREHDWVVHYRPTGVAGLIVPWNFPLAMLAKKLSAAIAAGAPCVIKPAKETPLTTLALEELLRRIELPPDWVRVVIGDAKAIGGALCEHPAVRCISFTGSTEVGKILIRQTAEHVKRLTLELGGNAPLIVFEDAHLDACVDHLVANKFRCAGQTCVCVNRVYVHADVAQPFTDKVKQRVSRLKFGDGMRPGIDLGPLINRAGFDKVAGHVRDAVRGGARVETGGIPDLLDSQSYGLFFPPTVLSNVAADARCVREETFGPVVPIVPFTREHQVIDWANGTEYGLAAYLFTADADRARRVIRSLIFGHVGHNSATGPTPQAPFGGMKQSGFGREGGREGLMEFVEPQVVARATR